MKICLQTKHKVASRCWFTNVNMKNKVFVRGYFAGNLGDDLLLQTLVARYPNCLFTIFVGSEYISYYRDIPSVRVMSYTRMLRLANWIMQRLEIDYQVQCLFHCGCDAIVQIGGDLYDETFQADLHRYDHVEIVNRPLYLLGQNFGPYQTESFRDFCEERFRQALCGERAFD